MDVALPGYGILARARVTAQKPVDYLVNVHSGNLPAAIKLIMGYITQQLPSAFPDGGGEEGRKGRDGEVYS